MTFVASNALALVSEIRAFVRVEVRACDAFLAVSEPAKCVANLSCWVNTNVREPTFLVGASRLLEMKAGWDVVWGGLVGESTVFA